MTGTIPFHKYQGTGNDFVLLEDADGSLEMHLTRSIIAQLCDRRFGIGADGLILLQKSGGYDFRMVYYNSDGAESSFCGNGSRCIVAFAQRLGWVTHTAWFVASDGDHEATLDSDGGVSVHMRSVREWQQMGQDVILDTGSPHFVRFMDPMPEGNIEEMSRAIRYSPPWKEAGINVNFVAEKAGILHVRTYERGVEGETLSCGTGVTASALAWAVRHAHQGKLEVEVQTPGGRLKVSWEAGSYGFRDVWLHGPAEHVFEGVFDLNYFQRISTS